MKYTSIDIPGDRQYQAYKCVKSELGLPDASYGPVQNLNWKKVIWTSRTIIIDRMVMERFFFRNEKHAVWFALRWL